ncbi:MAG TPA: Glu/Leu/Phe/Val dehydrogenase dimerization domain-containing protein [Gemmatimonadaceae bacterium]|nr:Glu/Leu/Phe/Val dehydrogenase dimerization domain-containing protein [Gemmatimonadaceae bacterium]
MNFFETIAEMGHEQIAICHDKASGYRGIIAIHSTVLGPALGGTRFWQYDSDEAALTDALRLARGMTYKNAVAGLNLGGGKAVIIGDNQSRDREMTFRAHGRFVESLGGRYITAEDVGTSTGDMDYVHMETEYVAGLGTRSGDPSPVTARGVFRSILASAQWRWGSTSLEGKTVVVQGIGNVGRFLCGELAAVGAKLKVYDLRAERAEAMVKQYKATMVSDQEVYTTPADIFAPCALGAILNDDTIPKLKCEIVAGGANNQLLERDRHAAALEQRNILYAPDFVANAGGVINVYSELVGWTHERALRKADEIFDTLLGVYKIAKEQKITTALAADRLAERRLAQVGGLVKTWPQFPRKS